MHRQLKPLIMLAFLAGIFFAVAHFRNHLPISLAETLGLRENISDIRARKLPAVSQALTEQGLQLGAPVFIRIFKEERQLELWVQNQDRYSLFRSYGICNYSGDLGPKLREGDRQSPEGIYHVSKRALNPNSSYHLSFNLGFPNAYDTSLGRTGSYLMVHGDCVSIGCYAMTDPQIEEIYLLVEAALENGQVSVPVHAFPFRMTEQRMAQAQGGDWVAFWRQLEPIYRAFEQNNQIPEISVIAQKYVLY